MDSFMLIAVLIFTLIVAGLGIALAIAQRKADSVAAHETAGRHPQGYWMGVGIASGLLIGYVLSLITGVIRDDMRTFIVFGPAIGLPLGAIIGVMLERRHKHDVRPLTPAEQRARQSAQLGGIVMLLVGVLVLVGVLFLVA